MAPFACILTFYIMQCIVSSVQRKEDFMYFEPEYRCRCGKMVGSWWSECPIKRKVRSYSWEERLHQFVGHNAKNNAKLMAHSLRKHSSYGFGRATEIIETETRCGTPVYYVIESDTPEQIAYKKLQEEANRAKNERMELARKNHYRAPYRNKGVRKKRYGKKHWTTPSYPPPVFDEMEELEKLLSKPRYRKQRGFGDVYRPSRHRNYTKDEKRTWKRQRKNHWHQFGISFRLLVREV